jgi:nucleoside-diphosphate-sugar epimerase
VFVLIDAKVSGAIEYFNIRTGMEHSVRELVEMMANIAGRRIEIGVDPRAMRQVDRPSQLANMTKTFSRLTWQPAYSLDEALKSILSYSMGFRTLEDTSEQVSTSFLLSENWPCVKERKTRTGAAV